MVYLKNVRLLAFRAKREILYFPFSPPLARHSERSEELSLRGLVDFQRNVFDQINEKWSLLKESTHLPVQGTEHLNKIQGPSLTLGMTGFLGDKKGVQDFSLRSKSTCGLFPDA